MENTKLYVLISFIILIEVQGSGVDITFLESAKAKGAVCLDGSAPAYQFDKGVGAGANNWLVHIQGGGWCTSLESCHNRTRPSSDMGSSHYMRKSKFSGILSHKKKFNPNFYNWNRILVRYCDGSSFTGDVEEVEPKFGLHFRGARVFDAIMEDLLARGMKNASNALLSGCSAGGLASILHCDKFRALVPTCARVKCVSDAGYFIHVKDISGRYHFEEKYFDRVVKLHGSSKNLPLSCTSKMKDGLCFYPQYAAPHIQTPLFIINSVYDIYQISNILAPTANGRNGSWFECQYNYKKCSHSQIRTLQDFRLQFWRALLSGLANSSSTGMFINSCYTHCQSEFRKKWYGDPASKMEKKAIGEAVGDWFYDRTAFQHIDDKHLHLIQKSQIQRIIIHGEVRFFGSFHSCKKCHV